MRAFPIPVYIIPNSRERFACFIKPSEGGKKIHRKEKIFFNFNYSIFWGPAFRKRVKKKKCSIVKKKRKENTLFFFFIIIIIKNQNLKI